LQKVDTQRAQARRARERNAVPLVSLVGYTNAGKSTLFNALTDAGVYVADLLFATLDPTLRRIDGLNCGPIILADTVGFIRDLPHDLIAAFKSTLAETRDADLLLHVVDAADAEHAQRIEEVQRVLEEIGAQDVPQILVFNKIDKLGNAEGPPQPRFETIDGGRTPRVWVSATHAIGLDLLRDAIARTLQGERVHRWLHVPDAAGRLRARLFAQGLVASERPADSGWELEIDAPRALVEPLFGLPGGDGDWLRKQLEIPNAA
jgi:GTP-binding protein HflX